MVIAGVFIWQRMVFVLRKHWQWLNNGGGGKDKWGYYHGRKLGPYQRLTVGAVGGCSWVVDGGARVYIYI